MRDACVRALELGPPGVTFTDHADLTMLVVSGEAAAYIQAIGGTVTDGIFEPPFLDVAGYLDCVDQRPSEFASLRIRAGVELGDPHLHPEAAAALAAADSSQSSGRYFETDCAALRALAGSGRALEINTSGWLPLDASLLSWWRAEGGQTASFGSDAHDPVSLGREFTRAAALAMAAGFGPDSDGSDLWLRC
jgi:histidinol phosphatase-like PHP family hydrolase